MSMCDCSSYGCECPECYVEPLVYEGPITKEQDATNRLFEAVYGPLIRKALEERPMMTRFAKGTPA